MDRIGGDQGEAVCVWDQAGLKVVVDHGCYAEMTWRYNFADEVDVVRLAHHLLEHGWRDHSRFARVREVESSGGHRLVLVPSTGRIQLRLHYLTTESRRREEARGVAALLVAARAEL